MASWDMYKSIVRDALQEAVAQSHAPVPGAKLNMLIRKKATTEGNELPPAGALFKFADFLKSFPDVVEIVYRPGQDFLAVPPNREGLADAVDGIRYIRKDLFDAFSRFDKENKAWYNPAFDKIIWRRLGEQEPDCIPIPPATLDNEIGIRSAFTDTIKDEAVKSALLTGLATPRPLSEFTRLLKELRLQPQWHKYRYENVLGRINSWVASQSIPFNDAWISFTSKTQYGQPVAIARQSREHLFLAALGKLNEEDLSRVRVPLDLVLKILRNMGQ